MWGIWDVLRYWGFWIRMCWLKDRKWIKVAPHCPRHWCSFGIINLFAFSRINLVYKLETSKLFIQWRDTLACNLKRFYFHIKTKIETGKWPNSPGFPLVDVEGRKKKCSIWLFPITINQPNERMAVILIKGFTLLSNYSRDVWWSIAMQICDKLIWNLCWVAAP